MHNYKVLYASPIGSLELSANQTSLLTIIFLDKNNIEAENANAVLDKTRRQLDQYFAGVRKTFDIPLELQGTGFQQKVWRALMQVPFGETASYLDIARRIDNPKAVRAVGGANNKNNIPIIIPCHRIIGKDGKLTGYAGGLWRKQWLLEHEGAFISLFVQNHSK